MRHWAQVFKFMSEQISSYTIINLPRKQHYQFLLFWNRKEDSFLQKDIAESPVPKEVCSIKICRLRKKWLSKWCLDPFPSFQVFPADWVLAGSCVLIQITVLRSPVFVHDTGLWGRASLLQTMPAPWKKHSITSIAWIRHLVLNLDISVTEAESSVLFLLPSYFFNATLSKHKYLQASKQYKKAFLSNSSALSVKIVTHMNTQIHYHGDNAMFFLKVSVVSKAQCSIQHTELPRLVFLSVTVV